jgi:2-oxoglutarate dehydrogenase E2 component (dihydrolipoamide succinyltransferase)
MATKVLVPRLGEGVEEVTITKWLKQVGDSINELDALVEVNTDKVDTEIPAPASGVILSIDLPEGQAARVGDLLATIGQPGEALAQKITELENPISPAHVEVPSSEILIDTRKKDLGFVSPVVAKIAAEHAVNLQQVQGSGLGGRITKNDVMAFIEKGPHLSATTPPSTPLMPVTSHTAPSQQAPLPLQPGDTLIKHSLMRKSIAEHMLASKRISPHVLTVMEVDLSRVVAHRAANKEAFARTGVNLTFTAYFMCAVVTALKTYPLSNSSWNDAGVIIHSAIQPGMATSLGEEGLIVPVIKNADNLSLMGMARAVNDLANRARNKKLQPDEVKGGTFTLTNHGVSGSLFAMPIINQPQCGILGVGAMQKRAVVITDAFGNDSIAIRPMVYLSYVFDHRILDGASADWFLAKVKNTLENWTD